MAIEVEIPRRLFTVEEYHRMAEVGIFHPGERVELIEGEIVQMSPIGPRHAGCVINATRLFITRLGDRAVVSPQNPVVIQPRSEPQPDQASRKSRRRAGQRSSRGEHGQDVATSRRHDGAEPDQVLRRVGIGDS